MYIRISKCQDLKNILYIVLVCWNGYITIKWMHYLGQVLQPFIQCESVHLSVHCKKGGPMLVFGWAR